ncbi:MAG TPA: PAS domain S-box protein, partial [Patescibacteria group bacterium]|nr:PAS domain S-box protein [Patescibacteria group bacterium]
MSVFNAVSVVIDAALLVSWGVMLALYLRRGTPQTARGPEREALETAIDELSQANAKAEAAIAVKNRFLESASYQLRTPLNTILGLSEMVASGFCGPCDNAKVGEYLNDIHASGLELLTVIDKLSAVATVEATANAARHSYRTIFEMSPDGMCLCRDGVVTFINSAGVRLLGGYDASQFEGKAFADFIHGADRSWAENNFATLIGEAHSTPMQLAHPGGKALDVVLTAAAVPDGDDIVLVVIRNISDVTRANRDVAAQVKRLNSILDTAVDAIVVCDERGLIETFNRSAEVMFGYTAADAIGRNVTILMTERDAFDHHRNIGRYAHTHESQV